MITIALAQKITCCNIACGCTTYYSSSHPLWNTTFFRVKVGQTTIQLTVKQAKSHFFARYWTFLREFDQILYMAIELKNSRYWTLEIPVTGLQIFPLLDFTGCPLLDFNLFSQWAKCVLNVQRTDVYPVHHCQKR